MSSFQITGLEPAAFLPLFELDDAELSARGIERITVAASPGYPCRITLEDAPPGEQVLLMTFAHVDGPTPFRASGPIYVRRSSTRCVLAPGVIGDCLRPRPLSLRAYDRRDRMVAATACAGDNAAAELQRLFNDDSVEYVHLHHAQRGCFLCRANRWSADAEQS
jgi:hypothetical protein